MKNNYLPYKCVIDEVREETFDTKTFRVRFADKSVGDAFEFTQGQFAEISVPGVGEAPISITSSPSFNDGLEFCIRACGSVTNAIHELGKGDGFFVRGPYGNTFPLEEYAGKDLLFVAGGIGLAPLRSVINQAFSQRDKYGRVMILYGAKNPAELCFTSELAEWSKMKNADVHQTVDVPDESWNKNVGVVTALYKFVDLDPEKTVSYVCGPPIMLKFATQDLVLKGFAEEKIFATLERHMKCGIGKCGHCNIGEKFVCVDGPVFSCAEMKDMRLEDN